MEASVRKVIRLLEELQENVGYEKLVLDLKYLDTYVGIEELLTLKYEDTFVAVIMAGDNTYTNTVSDVINQLKRMLIDVGVLDMSIGIMDGSHVNPVTTITLDDEYIALGDYAGEEVE